MTEQRFVILSLELHLFFGRIMKEHSFFMEAGFTPADPKWSKCAEEYKEKFENILHRAVTLGNGVIRPNVLCSGEIVTDYTLVCEQKTQKFTAIDINQDITKLELELCAVENPQISRELLWKVRELNRNVKPILDNLIAFKASLLNNILACNMFTANYPLLIEHILHEAEMYRSQLTALECGRNPDNNVKETELFWNQIMMEHALFIRGLLDPSEDALINTANNFAQEYEELLQEAIAATNRTIEGVTNTTLEETLKYRDFKEAGTKGIAECRIRSIILPLLADHVLRESNHFIRLLKQFSQ